MSFLEDNNSVNLKTSSILGFLHAFGGQAVRLMLTVVYTVVLARLLTPGDYGLFTMAWVIVGFFYNIRDLGLASATIQSPDLDKEELNALFWLNALIGAAFTLLIMLCAHLFAKLYGRNELFGIFITLAVIFLLSGFNVQLQAVMRRKMEFLTINRIHNVSLLLGISVAIGLAVTGAGHWSLVGLHLSNELAQTVLFWKFSHWKPSCTGSLSKAKPFLSYGKNLSIFNITQNFAFMFDQLILGWLWGASILGLYNRVVTLLFMPARHMQIPINQVSLSIMSKLQSKPDHFRRFYRRILNFIGFLWIPFLSMVGVFPKEMIYIVLGPQWTDGSGLLTILFLGVLPLPFYQTMSWVYQSLGKTRQLRNWGFFSTPVLIFILCLGAPYGSMGVAMAYSIGLNVLFVCRLFLIYKQTPICLSDFWAALMRPLVVGFIFFGVLLLTKYSASGLPSTLLLFVGIFCGLVSLFLLVTIWSSLRREIFYFPKMILTLRN